MSSESTPATSKGLKSMQQWLQTAITTPWLTQASSLADIKASENREFTRSARLGVYSGAYQGRLIECMQSEFPVLQIALGAPLFGRFASEYLIACPSQSYSLTALGKRFPEYLRTTRPSDQKELWPEFIIELATLERLFSEVYHAEGTEELQQEHAAADTATILKEPATRSMTATFPVDRYFVEARKSLRDDPQAASAPEFPNPESVCLLVFRRNYSVQLRRIALDELRSENELPERSPSG